MNVNYLIEIIRMDEWEFHHPISATAYKLMHKLYNYANMEQFPEWIEIPNARLTAIVGCTESTLAAARLTLIQKGLIEYKKKGKGKAATCWYRINYFSLRRDYYRNNYGNNAGENNGENTGNSTGENNGENAGPYINKTIHGEREEEEDWTNDNDPTGEGTLVVDPVHHRDSPTPPEGLVGVQSGARGDERTPAQRMLDEQRMLEAFKRRGRKLVYRPRSSQLGPVGEREVERIKGHLALPDIRHLYGDGIELLRQIADSDYYPLMLIDYAVEKTVERNGIYPDGLSCPIAYTIKLLDDWKRQGFHMPVDVRRSKDDYSDSY